MRKRTVTMRVDPEFYEWVEKIRVKDPLSLSHPKITKMIIFKMRSQMVKREKKKEESLLDEIGRMDYLKW